MKRIVKDPEIRKNELIDIATQLFIKKGFEETSVSDIVKKANVAQGTFYYYFKSKEIILDAIIEKFLNEMLNFIEKLVENKNKNAIEKFLEILQFKMEISASSKKFWSYILSNKNTILHLKFEKDLLPKLGRPLSKIIKQGVDQGLFDCEFVDIAALYILNINVSMSVAKDLYNKSPDEQKKLIFIIFTIIERILGAKPGIFIEYIKKEKMEVGF